MLAIDRGDFVLRHQAAHSLAYCTEVFARCKSCPLLCTTLGWQLGVVLMIRACNFPHDPLVTLGLWLDAEGMSFSLEHPCPHRSHSQWNNSHESKAQTLASHESTGDSLSYCFPSYCGPSLLETGYLHDSLSYCFPSYFVALHCLKLAIYS